MCVIVMYKLSVGYAKFFCDFFASMASFRQNSAEFSAKLAGNRLPNFQKIRPIIRLIGRISYVQKFSVSFTHQLYFRPNFPDFYRFFSNFLIWHDFSFPAELCNTGRLLPISWS
jgi:hypothetical protein